MLLSQKATTEAHDVSLAFINTSYSIVDDQILVPDCPTFLSTGRKKQHQKPKKHIQKQNKDAMGQPTRDTERRKKKTLRFYRIYFITSFEVDKQLIRISTAATNLSRINGEPGVGALKSVTCRRPDLMAADQSALWAIKGKQLPQRGETRMEMHSAVMCHDKNKKGNHDFGYLCLGRTGSWRGTLGTHCERKSVDDVNPRLSTEKLPCRPV